MSPCFLLSQPNTQTVGPNLTAIVYFFLFNFIRLFFFTFLLYYRFPFFFFFFFFFDWARQ